MDLQGIGRVMLVVGIGIALLGVLFLFLSKIPFLNHFGNLPGDIRIHRDGLSCFVPIASMILLSVLLTLVINFVIRLINKQ